MPIDINYYYLKKIQIFAVLIKYYLEQKKDCHISEKTCLNIYNCVHTMKGIRETKKIPI